MKHVIAVFAPMSLESEDMGFNAGLAQGFLTLLRSARRINSEYLVMNEWAEQGVSDFVLGRDLVDSAPFKGENSTLKALNYCDSVVIYCPKTPLTSAEEIDRCLKIQKIAEGLKRKVTVDFDAFEVPENVEDLSVTRTVELALTELDDPLGGMELHFD